MRMHISSPPFLIAITAFLAALSAAQPASQTNGDGGPAIEATINGPSDISLDQDGNIYFIEMITGRIRKIDAKTGIIHTVATGRNCCMEDKINAPGTLLFTPIAISADASGNIYADDLAGQIWSFAASTSLGDTADKKPVAVAASKPEGGSAIGEYEQLRGIATDSQGSIFVVGSSSGKIYKISQGIATVLAGSGSRAYAGDGGPAAQAAFNWPMGIAFNAAGDLFVADYENCRIRRIDKTTTTVSTIAGSGKCTSTGDDGMAADATVNHPSSIVVDRDGNIYFTDSSPACVRRIDAKTATIRSVPGTCESKPGKVGAPSGLAVDRNGNLYISSIESNVIKRIDARTGEVKTIAGNGLPDRFDVMD